MIKIIAFILLLTVCCAFADETDTTLEKTSKNGGRQKRLLFYDEDGNLVKTYTNPYLKDFALEADRMPFYGNFMNPFYAFIRASYGGSSSAFTIPVSNEIIEKIQRDPEYQFRLAVEPKKDPVIAPNAFCEGKRTQLPSPQHCNNFLNCWDGWAFEQECPDGLLFSREGYCDYSYNVDCKNREILIKPVAPSPVQPQPSQPMPQPTTSPPPQGPPLSQPSSPSPQVPPQSQPSSPPTQPQPQPQPQLPCLQQTAPTPQTINSEPKPQPPQPQTIPAQPPQLQPQPIPAQPPKPQPRPVVPKCTEQYKTYRSPYNCKEFYICVDGKLDRYVCTGDLVYSEDAGLCFPRGLVNCGSTPIDKSPTKLHNLNDNYKFDYVKIN